MTNFHAREQASAPLMTVSVGWVPPNAVGTGGRVHSNAVGDGGQVASSSVQSTGGPEGDVEMRVKVRREECIEMKGAQHEGTVRGFGAINGSRERGRRR